MEEEIILYNKNRKRLPVNKSNYFSCQDVIKILNKTKGNGKYSLEPGGQIEWSSLPYKNLNDLDKAQKKHRNTLKMFSDQNNLEIIGYAVDPYSLPQDVDLIDEEKYQLMDQNMIKNGTMGRWMMRNTASVQINFDITSEKALEEIVFIADCINPISAYLFSNGPMMNGKRVNNKNIRNIIWENTDNIRCRNLIDHGINKSEDLINNYINYLEGVPGIFQLNREGIIQSTKGTLLDRLKFLDEINSLTDKDISAALHQIFTNVRLKNLIEIRGADRPPLGYEMAPVSFWTGLLMVDSVRSEIYKEVNNWTYEDRIKFNNASLYLDDSKVIVRRKKYSFWNRWFGELAIIGLKERGMGEETLFEDFFNVVMEKGPFSLQLQ